MGPRFGTQIPPLPLNCVSRSNPVAEHRITRVKKLSELQACSAWLLAAVLFAASSDGVSIHRLNPAMATEDDDALVAARPRRSLEEFSGFNQQQVGGCSSPTLPYRDPFRPIDFITRALPTFCPDDVVQRRRD